jgi:hypothetical protein
VIYGSSRASDNASWRRELRITSAIGSLNPAAGLAIRAVDRARCTHRLASSLTVTSALCGLPTDYTCTYRERLGWD